MSLSIDALERWPSPFIWIDLIWAGWCVLIVWASPHVWLRVSAACLAAVFITLGALEGYFDVAAKLRRHASYDPSPLAWDDQFGMKPNQRPVHRGMVDDTVIFEVMYTIGLDGLRITDSPQRELQGQPCVLFFGGSFTFGEGVKDNESLPYQVHTKTKGVYRTLNFGAPGQGPQHMLRALQLGYVGPRADCQVEQVIYQAIPDHAGRAVGLRSWSDSDSYYRLDEAGHPVYVGPFRNVPARDIFGRMRRMLDRMPEPVREGAKKSGMLQNLLSRHRRATPEEVETFAAIVAGAKDHVGTLYPRAGFHVLYWDFDEQEDTVLPEQALKRRRVTIHRMSCILPLLHSAPHTYALHPRDHHPNAVAHEAIATYVVRNILKEEPGGGHARSQAIPMASACNVPK